MLSFERAQDILTEAADRLPEEIYRSLNGGIVLSTDTLPHPQGGGLYILGQYHYDPWGFGRYITIYYGSFRLAHGRLSEQQQEEKLREVLFHELTHHLEHLAGDRSLEIQDAVDLEKHLRNDTGN